VSRTIFRFIFEPQVIRLVLCTLRSKQVIVFMKKIALLLITLFSASVSNAQVTPVVTHWIINTTHATGYHALPTNVQQVQYSDSDVYVTCSCIPGYDIGPWNGNPNIPANQNFEFKITRSPQKGSGKIATPLGHVGVWTNGVSLFNAKDARSYNNQGVWNQNAILVEGASFDSCLGHPAPNGEYHHHLSPRCLYDETDSAHHSPIIGFAFDGFPIYGAYGFAEKNGSGGIKRMNSGFKLRTITDRSSLPDGTQLTGAQNGPAISTTYPLGYYIEDFSFDSTSGDLDEHNGRFCVTPDYPNGTYAYFTTIDSNLKATYPYTLGATYYGTLPAGNTGPQSGHNTPIGKVVTYTGNGVAENIAIESGLTLYPNPAQERIYTNLADASEITRNVEILDAEGRIILNVSGANPTQALDISRLSSGAYFVRLQTTSGKLFIAKFAK
jgi:hypothetical protein